MEDLIDRYSLFGGSENIIELSLYNNNILSNIKELINSNFKDSIPFYLFEEPYRNFLITVARKNNKVHSAFMKNRINKEIARDILDELLEKDIITLIKSREKPFKKYSKQLIKKEYRKYEIQNKIIFNKPVYKFWFGFIEPFYNKKGKIDINRVINEYKRNGHKLSSFIFEELSIELLREYFHNEVPNCYSYWDYFNEFDIYCNINNIKIIGECKYTSRCVTKGELLKLQKKLEVSNLDYDYIALFSKSGFSNELKKLDSKNLLLFKLDDYKKLLT